MRALLAVQGWSPYVDGHGNGRKNVAFTITDLSSVAAPVYTTESGSTQVASLVTSPTKPFGVFPGWMEVGSYLLTIEGATTQVEVVSGRTSGAATPLDDSVTLAKLNAAVKPSPSGSAAAGDLAVRALGHGATQALPGDEPLLPSAGQKNAFAGTDGTPGTGNEFVTKQGMTAEQTARASADSSEASARAAADTAEASARAAADALLIPLAQKGAASGVADLDSRTKVPAAKTYRSPWHIEAFGGVPNDASAAATNDAAFAAAVAALPSGGGAIDVSGAKYHVTTRIAIDKSNVQVYGDGPQSGLVFTAGAKTVHNLLRFNSTLSNDPVTAPRLSNIELCFMSIDGAGGDITWPAGGLTGTAVAYCCDDVRFHHLTGRNGRDHCFRHESCTDASMSYVTADGTYAQSACNPLNMAGSSFISAGDLAYDHCTVKNAITLTITAATRSGTTATFTTSAPHKMSSSQYVKVTGCTPNDYNGFWKVDTTPTSTTFTVPLDTTPAGSASVVGSARLMADRGIYVGGHNASRVSATYCKADHCTAAITSESSGPGEVTDLDISHNTASNFSVIGVGVSTSAGSPGLYAQRGMVNENTARGLVGTTEFGNAGKGSLTGVEIVGSHLEANGNLVSNVRQGLYGGLGTWAVNEANLQVVGGEYLLASDATGQGIMFEHTDATTALRKVKIANVTVDGGLGTASDSGILLKGRIIGFGVVNCDVYGMGRSGIKLEASGSAVPSAGHIIGNDCWDNANAGSSTINKCGIALDSAADDVRLGLNKCYDTRGGSALQVYGLHVAATATNVRSSNDDFTGNLTGEVNDLTLGVGFRRIDYRDPDGLGSPENFRANELQTAAGFGAANRCVYTRIRRGGATVTGIEVNLGALDSSTPGTSDQVWVGIHKNNGSAGSGARPTGGKKLVSPSRTPAGTGFRTIDLGGTVRLDVGDWVVVKAASSSTTFVGTTAAVGSWGAGQNGFEDVGAGVAPPDNPASTAGSGTGVRVPLVRGIP